MGFGHWSETRQGGNLGSEGDVGSRVPSACRHAHASNNLPHRGLHPPHLCAPRAGQSLRRHKIPWPARPVSVFTKAVNTCRPPTPVLLWRGGAPEALPVGTGPPELSDPAPPQVPGLISPHPHPRQSGRIQEARPQGGLEDCPGHD